MNRALHPRDDLDRLYLLRKEDGNGIDCIDCVYVSIWQLKGNIKKAQKKFYYIDEKQYRSHKNQQNNNN